ncbi:uncharacterized protein [Mytilus edulis]|uniref:uncharacterized protein isoform X1 n=1 Tax=Mytilus edulis TaxID=6550 RepID=UPI0039F097DF
MDYHRNWRKYHAEVDALAETSDSHQDCSPHSTDHENFEDQFSGNQEHEDRSTGVADHESDNAINSDREDLDMQERWSTDSFDSNNSDENVTSDDNDMQEQIPDLAAELAGWATSSECTRSSLDALLEILRKQGLRLPKDSRTLLKTPRSINTIKKCGGDYLYLGLETGLLKVISENLDHFKNVHEILLSINIDGLPLFKSSGIQLWPILCSIKKFEPFVVAVYCSDSKPTSVDEYLYDFLSEFTDLQQNGINVNEEIGVLRVKIRAFVCDAPARAFVKCTKSHNAYFACERCTIKGIWCQNRVVFKVTDDMAPKRTEESFKNYEYKIHQVAKSPLIDAGLACIKSFPLDYMHLVCLGIVKRTLTFFRQGPRDFECRLSHQQWKIISDKLSFLNGKLPREFARQPRSLYYMDKWKATEFRQFVLYTGPLVMRSVVTERVYNHFLTLTVAMSILLEPDDNFRNAHLDYARELLVYYVKTAPILYSDTFVSYNVHSLMHLADDVEHFGSSLNEINAFQFENHLFKLKKSVRKPQNPIAQVAKRIVEMEKSKCRRKPRTIHVFISKTKKDSCFLLKNKTFVFVREKRENKTYLCDVISQNSLENFFENPCNSKILNIFVLKNNQRQFRRILVDNDDIQKKVVCLPYERHTLLLPMLHGMERW